MEVYIAVCLVVAGVGAPIFFIGLMMWLDNREVADAKIALVGLALVLLCWATPILLVALLAFSTSKMIKQVLNERK